MTRVGTPMVRAALAAFLMASLGWAQEEDRPALGVARVSLTNGDVTIRRGDSGDWIQAPVNTPLVEGDRIASGAASRTEVQLDSSNLLRLNESTEVHMANLGNRQFRLQVERGVVTYGELRGGEADIDIETPLVAVRPGKNGRYRVEVVGQDLVRIIVREGEAQIASAQGVETLKRGRMMVVRRGAEKLDGAPEFAIEKAPPKDNWDEFNERRDKHLEKSDSYRKLSRSIYGAEDLDQAGRWHYVSGYGNSWFPSVSAGWAPYRHGRWTWVGHYGWTWLSYEPWGWAPYHYGRWFHHAHHGWGWYPGSYYGHHYWRPALVAFFGHGHYVDRQSFNFGFGFGGGHYGYSHFGWVPLAPGERYYPWYGHHYRGGRRNSIYVDNSINIYNNYRNARHHNGASAIRGEVFARGRVGTPQSLRPSQIREASLVRGQLPIVPSVESRGRRASPTDFRRASENSSSGTRFFTANRGRATAQRSSFQQQQERVAGSVREFARTRSRGTGGGTTAAASRGAVGAAGLEATSTTARARTGLAARSLSTVRTPSVLGTARSATTTTTRGRASTARQPATGRGRTGATRSRGATAQVSSDSTSPRAATQASTQTRFQGFPRARTGSAGTRSQTGASPLASSSLAPTHSGPLRAPTATRPSGGGGSRTAAISETSAWRQFGRGRATSGRTAPGWPATAATTPWSQVRQRGGSSSRTFELSRPVTSFTPATRSRTGARRSRPSAPTGNTSSPARSVTPSATAARSASSTPTSRSRTFTPRSRSRVPSAPPLSRSLAPSTSSRRSSPTASSRSGGFAPRARSRVPTGGTSRRSLSSGLSSRVPSTSSRSTVNRSRSLSRGRSAMPSGRSVAPSQMPTIRAPRSMPRGSVSRGRMPTTRSSGSMSRGRSMGTSRGSVSRSPGAASRSSGSRGSALGRSRR